VDEVSSPATAPVGTTGRRLSGRELALGLLFLVPALFVLGVWLVYPVLFTIWRSFFDAGGDFAGVDNYRRMVEEGSAARTAVRNNFIWVIFAPALATAIGVVLAVLTERVRFSSVFKALIFMPMAISFLAAGVIFRFVYDEDPDQGLANALLTSVTDLWESPGPLVGAKPSETGAFEAQGKAFVSTGSFSPGEPVLIGVVGIRPDDAPAAAPAATARPPSGTVGGTVWLDFTRGGGGERGVIDDGEQGLPGVEVEVLDRGGRVVGSATTDDTGAWRVEDVGAGSYGVRLVSSNFDLPWTGFRFLGETLVTPSVIGAFLWIWTGFAMVVVAAGLAAIPRETLEAARVDGANEWQVFRRVTLPQLWPVLLVVLVTLVINVLKIFDLVLVIPPGNVQDDANVIALELWRTGFGANDHGLASALGVLLFVLVVPAMLFNIRRFRAEES
jgi:alpha-glucoside transport system permease protein